MPDDDFEIGSITAGIKPSRPREELKDIAMGIIQGNIFHSIQIRQHDMHLLQSIFMPLIFLDEVQFREMREAGVYSFYGTVSGQSRSINGYPMLMNMGWMTKEETDQLIEIYNRIQQVFKDL